MHGNNLIVDRVWTSEDFDLIEQLAQCEARESLLSIASGSSTRQD